MDLGQLQTKAAFFEEQYKVEKADRRAAQAELEAVKSKIAGANAGEASFRKRMLKEADRCCELEGEINDYKEEVAELQWKCKGLEEDNQKLKSEADELKRKCRDLRKENQKLKSEAGEAPTNDGAPADDETGMAAGRTGEASQEEAPGQPNAPPASGASHQWSSQVHLPIRVGHTVLRQRAERNPHEGFRRDHPDRRRTETASSRMVQETQDRLLAGWTLGHILQPRTRGSDRQEQAQPSSEDGPGINNAGEATPVDDRQDKNPDEFAQGGWIYLQRRTHACYSWIEDFLERQAQLMGNLVFIVKDVPLMRADLFQLKKESHSLREEIGKLNDRDFPPVETGIPHMRYGEEPRPNVRSQDCGDEVRRGVKELQELLGSLERLLKAQRDHCYRLEDDMAALVDYVRCLRLYDPEHEESRAEENRAEENRAEENRAEDSRAEDSRAEDSRAEKVSVARSIERSLDEIHSRNSRTEEVLRGLENLVK
ncbi:MAG: hypothetical protein LQ348_004442, partial [Seirophora lacunosa]